MMGRAGLQVQRRMGQVPWAGLGQSVIDCVFIVSSTRPRIWVQACSRILGKFLGQIGLLILVEEDSIA